VKGKTELRLQGRKRWQRDGGFWGKDVGLLGGVRNITPGGWSQGSGRDGGLVPAVLSQPLETKIGGGSMNRKVFLRIDRRLAMSLH